MTYKMSDIKAIIVVVGAGGKVAGNFDHDSGELRLWVNEQVKSAPEDATKYNLAPGCAVWSMDDDDD